MKIQFLSGNLAELKKCRPIVSAFFQNLKKGLLLNFLKYDLIFRTYSYLNQYKSPNQCRRTIFFLEAAIF